MLGNMKTIHMLGFGDILFKIISRMREAEIQTSARFRKLLIWQVALSNVPVTLAPFATLTVYAIIAVVKENGAVLSTTAFTTLTLIAILTNPLLVFCQAMPAILQAMACFGRIEKYCLGHQTMQFDSPVLGGYTENEKLKPDAKLSPKDDTLVSFKNAQISWSSQGEPVFRDLNLSFNRGIVMVIGPVGSGKSTLIESLVNQFMVVGGELSTSFLKSAYCPQNPWIQNDTIRNNIIGDSEFHKGLYEFTIEICGLKEDLIAIPEGDLRVAGSDGHLLSGGQKQQISLARAVYSKLDVIILDDCFSGLDAGNISQISKKLLDKEGYFRSAGKSVIFATNTYQMLHYADEIIVLDQGKVSVRGSFDEIGTQIPQITMQIQAVEATPSFPEVSELSIKEIEHEIRTVEIRTSIDQSTEHKGNDYSRQQRSWTVYRYYFQNAGNGLIVFLAFAIGEAFCTSFQTLWMQWWVEANEKQPNYNLRMYLGVYAMIFGLSFVAVIADCWVLFVRVLSNTSLNLHSELLIYTLRAPLSFFQKSDTGSLLNRFSQDLELVDMMLPIYAVNFVMGLLTVLINMIVICVLGKLLGSSIPFLILVLFLLQSYYLRTSRQIRLLDIEAKAPLYAHFLETIKGVSSIHAFGWDDKFREKNLVLLNQSQRPMHMLFCIQQWLSLVLDLVVGLIAILLITIITSVKEHFGTAPVGVALTLLLTLNKSLTQTIKMWTMTETSIGAVSRIHSFVKDTPSNSCNTLSLPPHHWPQQGTISFQNVTASYGLGSDPVIKNFNLEIHAGEKVAICGSSSSGKSSLLMTIFQMLNLQSGNIIIDGLDICELERSSIQNAINIISQEPYFLPGTLRFNLDPYARASDEYLISAIMKVGLWGHISAKGGLDMSISDSQWSAGQSQLLSLARALVVKALILVLDEATSSVDWETESVIQSIIETEFSKQTITSVVHRFRYIERFDRVAVLQHGRLLEVDKPKTLLSKDSRFKKLYDDYAQKA